LVKKAALALLLAGAAWYWWRQSRAEPGYSDPEIEPDWTDEAEATMLNVANTVTRTAASQMDPSPRLLVVLKKSEDLRLSRYQLGDGGWTIGYGRYYPFGGAEPPQTITQATAEQWFAQDVEERGARWVRAYVRADLSQNEFDALTHMAFNLKPKSFKTIAEAVNQGQDPEAAAMQYIRAGTNLESGLRNRRLRELAMYRHGTYA
jgi:lysozyme